MGVVNITPNSFSDGGKFNSLDAFQRRLKRLLDDECDIVDIGGESTAPMNNAINLNEEIKRFDIVFKSVDLLDRFEEISIDTYKPEVIEYLLTKATFKKLLENKKLIWNDVSGKLDQKQIEILTKLPNLKYVFSHNEVPNRDLTLKHLDYTKKSYDLSYFKNYFKHQIQFILDPCFGFSKSREQNLKLLNDIHKLINEFGDKWIVGISRKSFLRNLPKDHPKSIYQAELQHISYLVSILSKLDHQKEKEIILRIHDSEVYKALSNFFTNSMISV